MKRMSISILTMLMALIFIPMSSYAIGGLTDINSHWAKKEIAQGVAMGFINGYPGGIFKPDANIQRDEFTKALVSALGYEPSSQASVFTDDNTWAEGYIQTAIEKGIIKVEEYADLKFEPAKKITRQEIAVMTVRAMDKEKEATDLRIWDKIVSSFTDLGVIPEEVRGYVKIANDLGIIRGYADGSFGPAKNATRSEAVVMILRTVETLKPESIPTVDVTNNFADFGLKQVVEFPFTLEHEGLKVTINELYIYPFDSKKAQEIMDKYQLVYGEDVDIRYLAWTNFTIENTGSKVRQNNALDFQPKFRLAFEAKDSVYGLSSPAIAEPFTKYRNTVNNEELIHEWVLQPGEKLTSNAVFFHFREELMDIRLEVYGKEINYITEKLAVD